MKIVGKWENIAGKEFLEKLRVPQESTRIRFHIIYGCAKQIRHHISLTKIVVCRQSFSARHWIHFNHTYIRHQCFASIWFWSWCEPKCVYQISDEWLYLHLTWFFVVLCEYQYGGLINAVNRKHQQQLQTKYFQILRKLLSSYLTKQKQWNSHLTLLLIARDIDEYCEKWRWEKGAWR